MQEVNDHTGALDEGTGQDRGQDQKENDLRSKIAPCFALKVIAADIEK